MQKFTEPEILIDKSRLPEIFDLRVFAWENSPSTSNINRENFPNGLFDRLDETAIHWVSLDEAGGIVAAARLAAVNDVSELPFPKIFAGLELPPERPFLYYSRLVIHPDYRKQGLKEKLDRIRLCYKLANNFAFSLATASQNRAAQLAKYGWKDRAEVSEKIDSDFPFGKEVLMLLRLGNVNLENY